MIQIFSTFEHTLDLELAISALERAGIPRENIFAVPLNNRKTERKLFDSIHQSDGISLVSTGAALGTAFSVIGASVGFRLDWGPIYWGLIGVGAGFLLGVTIDLIHYKVIKRLKHPIKQRRTEVILIVQCPEEQGDQVEKALWHFLALGIARIG